MNSEIGEDVMCYNHTYTTYVGLPTAIKKSLVDRVVLVLFKFSDVIYAAMESPKILQNIRAR